MDERKISDDCIRSAVVKYSDTVFRAAYQYLKNRADAEDIVQEVFFALLSQNNFESDAHLKNWLVRVAVNKSINAYKSRKVRRAAEIDENIPARDGDGSLEYVLEKLPPLDREIIYLFYYEGYSAEEIGKFVKKSQSAVQKRLSRARQQLKKFLEEDGQ